MSSPPGLSTRMKSSSVASGSGTAVMTYCATTASKEESANARFLASITASVSTLARPSARTRLCALRSIGSEISTPHNFVVGERRRDVGGVGDLGVAVDRDVIVVVDPAEVVLALVPGERGRVVRVSLL